MDDLKNYISRYMVSVVGARTVSMNQFIAQKNGKSVAGMLFKATSEQSNLRWDVKLDDLRFYYRKGNRVQVDDWWALYGLNQALAGGGTISRSLFVLEYLDLPEVGPTCELCATP